VRRRRSRLRCEKSDVSFPKDRRYQVRDAREVGTADFSQTIVSLSNGKRGNERVDEPRTGQLSHHREPTPADTISVPSIAACLGSHTAELRAAGEQTM
jgi:hypothetical protein